MKMCPGVGAFVSSSNMGGLFQYHFLCQRMEIFQNPKFPKLKCPGHYPALSGSGWIRGIMKLNINH